MGLRLRRTASPPGVPLAQKLPPGPNFQKSPETSNPEFSKSPPIPLAYWIRHFSHLADRPEDNGAVFTAELKPACGAKMGLPLHNFLRQSREKFVNRAGVLLLGGRVRGKPLC